MITGGLDRDPGMRAFEPRLDRPGGDAAGAFTIEEDAPFEDVGLASEAAVEDLIDAADYAVIGPVDGRRRVRDTARSPYRAICHLRRDFGGTRSGCTGALIGPRHVLTAGHCLLSRHGRPPRAIDVLIGRDGASVVARVRSTRFYAPGRSSASAIEPTSCPAQSATRTTGCGRLPWASRRCVA